MSIRMDQEQIVALAVRLFSIVVAIYALRGGISLVPYFYERGWEQASYIYAGIMVLLIILAVSLWKFPLSVAHGLINFQQENKTDTGSINAEQFQLAGFNILGLYLLFYVISDIIYWVTILFISQRNKAIPLDITLEQKALMVSTFIEFIFVLFLLFGAKGISRLFKKFRYGSFPHET